MSQTNLLDLHPGIVLSLCDYTGIMVKPWAEAGWECWCVDLQHSMVKDRIEGNIRYVWGDIRSWLPPHANIAILFAFPPCTDLAASGRSHFHKKRGYRLSDALELFDACQMIAAYSGAPYLIENPVGRLSSFRRKPDHPFNPCDYGDPYTKLTCLWTGNGFVMPTKHPVEPTEGSKMHNLPPTPDRAHIRSQTPPGFARAVYEANHSYLLNPS